MVYRVVYKYLIIAYVIVRAMTMNAASVDSEGYNRGLVSLTFDDGYQCSYKYVLPILQKHQIYATFYVSSNLLNQSEYLTLEQVVIMSQLGHEIGSHAVNHRKLTSLSSIEMNRELIQSKQFLEALIQKPVESFAAPYGALNHQIYTSIQKYYRSNRTTTRGFNRMSAGDPFYLKMQMVFDKTAQNELEEWLNWAQKERKWLILVYHRIEEPKGFLTTSSENLEKHILAILEKQLKIITVSEGASLMKRECAQ